MVVFVRSALGAALLFGMLVSGVRLELPTLAGEGCTGEGCCCEPAAEGGSCCPGTTAVQRIEPVCGCGSGEHPTCLLDGTRTDWTPVAEAAVPPVDAEGTAPCAGDRRWSSRAPVPEPPPPRG